MLFAILNSRATNRRRCCYQTQPARKPGTGI